MPVEGPDFKKVFIFNIKNPPTSKIPPLIILSGGFYLVKRWRSNTDLDLLLLHLIITWGHNALRFVRFVRFEDIRSVQSHYYIRAQCVTVRSIPTVRRHTERASHDYIRAQCDTVRSIRTIRTAREAHSNCNIPRSINHKPTQAQKPRKAHSKCNIPRSINHKPTQGQKPRKAQYSKCNINSSFYKQ